jgi:hypothetical protein
MTLCLAIFQKIHFLLAINLYSANICILLILNIYIILNFTDNKMGYIYSFYKIKPNLS